MAMGEGSAPSQLESIDRCAGASLERGLRCKPSKVLLDLCLGDRSGHGRGQVLSWTHLMQVHVKC